MQRAEHPAHICPHCGTHMKHVRTIADLDDLPEIRIFYCAPCAHVETIKLKTPVPAEASG